MDLELILNSLPKLLPAALVTLKLLISSLDGGFLKNLAGLRVLLSLMISERIRVDSFSMNG